MNIDGAGAQQINGSRPRRTVGVRSTTVLLVLALLYTLYLTRQFVIPFVFALFLYFLLVPAVRALRRLRIPQTAAAIMVLGALLGCGFIAVAELAEPAREWNLRLPTLLSQIEAKVAKWQQPFRALTRTAERLEQMTELQQGAQQPVAIQRISLVDGIVSLGTSFLGGLLVVLVLLYFLFVFGEDLSRDLSLMLGLQNDRASVPVLFRDIERSASHYLTTVTAINLGVAAAESAALYALGMPNPVLWGIMAGLLKFVPYVGTAFGTGVIALISLVSFDDPLKALTVVVVYYCVAVADAIFITPAVLGKQFRFNPIIIFAWVALWGWLWGPAGILLAVPMLVTSRIFLEHLHRHECELVLLDRLPRGRPSVARVFRPAGESAAADRPAVRPAVVHSRTDSAETSHL